MKIIPLIFVTFFSHSLFARSNVILVTLDGVRFQEFFDGVQRRSNLPKGTELLPKLKESVKKGEAFLIKNMTIANTAALSLPGYRSILTGDFEKKCKTNNCSNIGRETIFDYLADLGLAKNQLGAFASWVKVGVALESRSGNVTRSVEMEDYVDSGLSPEDQSRVTSIQNAMTTDLPGWKGSRFDKYTHELGKIFIKTHQPQFTFISYVDSDEYAHDNNYNGYVRAIKTADDQLADLKKLLDSLGEYGEETSIVITTDHGRGTGLLWTSHTRAFPSANKVWAVVIPSRKILSAENFKIRCSPSYSHKDIRPTLETLLGIPVRTGNGKGASLINLK